MLKYKNGFSLIELSIVLIIIGLLVAGITGGQSLIESARNRNLISEMKNYDQALGTFYSLKDRLPGDINSDGIIGYLSKDIYNSNSYPAPYNSNSNEYKIPNSLSAPFVDLYLEKIIEFQPKKTNITGYSSNYTFFENEDGNPTSQAYKNIFYAYRTLYVELDPNAWRYGLPFKTYIFLAANKDSIGSNIARVMKNLDVKLDDGVNNRGRMRSYCNHGRYGYEDAIKYKSPCPEALFESSIGFSL